MPNRLPPNLTKIFIGNILEAFYSVYQGLPAPECSYWVTHDSCEANRSLLYNGDNKLVITSLPIHPKHLQYTCQLLGWHNVHNLYPASPSPSICKDILRDSQLHHQVINLIKRRPGIALIPYRGTPEFYHLVTYLKKQHLRFTTPETLPPNYNFIPAYCNTKKGFRHLWGLAVSGRHLPIHIPDGFIAGDKKEALDAAWWFRQQNRFFVIKHNCSIQGSGMKFFTTSKIPKTEKEFYRYLKSQLQDKLWSRSPLVVEEFIKPDQANLGGSPSVEFFIDQKGQVIPTYPVEQLLEKDMKTFKGCYIHPELNNHPLIKTAFKAGLFYGEQLSHLGYRGYFDMDLVIGKNGQLYAVETNLRRTGGTHVDETAKNLLGKNYADSYYVVSEDIHLPQKIHTSYEKLFTLLKPVLYQPKTKTGLIFGNPDLIQANVLHALYFSPNKKSLDNIRSQTAKLLTTL